MGKLREKKVPIQVHISPDDYRRLQILSERTMLPMSRLAREIIHEGVKEVRVIEPRDYDIPLF